MATSVIEICNNALLDLGADTITALDDTSKESRLCNQRWPGVRDAVLRAHPWKCALAQTDLAADSSAPTFQYSTAFPLPTDCLRVVIVEASGCELSDWCTEGSSILCDETGPLGLLYVKRVTNPVLYDALLCEALSARLAATLAFPLTSSTSLSQTFWSLYTTKLAEARGVDSREASPASLGLGSWIAAKLGAGAR